jgi:hypothetical protein
LLARNAMALVGDRARKAMASRSSCGKDMVKTVVGKIKCKRCYIRRVMPVLSVRRHRYGCHASYHPLGPLSSWSRW